MINPRPGLEEELRLNKEAGDKFRTMYYYRHMACPTCKSIHLTTTYMGIILNLDNMDSYKDTNIATCSCGWKGMVHDLKGSI